MRPDGQIDKRTGTDALRFVQAPFIGIMESLYLVSNDSQAIGQVLASDDIFEKERIGNVGSQKQSKRRYLMEAFASSMQQLAQRLQALDATHYVAEPELLNGHKDAQGDDLGVHFEQCVDIIRACNSFYSRFNTFVTPEAVSSAKVQSQPVRNSAVNLYGALSPYRYDKISKSLVELVLIHLS